MWQISAATPHTDQSSLESSVSFKCQAVPRPEPWGPSAGRTPLLAGPPPPRQLSLSPDKSYGFTEERRLISSLEAGWVGRVLQGSQGAEASACTPPPGAKDQLLRLSPGPLSSPQVTGSLLDALKRVGRGTRIQGQDRDRNCTMPWKGLTGGSPSPRLRSGIPGPGTPPEASS